MDLEVNTQYLQSPLVLWIRTFTGAGLADLTDLVDGLLLNKIMTEIDPTFFGMSFVHPRVHGDISLRVHNLGHLLRSLKNFYQERLQQMIVMDLPNIFDIANDPGSEESVQELNKILLLILGCAVQCERKEFFIDKITSMNESLQQELVLHIKEITEKCDKVFTFQPSDIATLSHEELLSFCEVMYDQMIKLVNQRDFNAEETHRLLVDRTYPTKEVNGNIRRVSSPPLSPTNSEMMSAEKAKIKQVTEELEEKNLMIQELKDELESRKLRIERLVQENKSLTETTRWVNAYRDQLDVLKIKAEKTSKLEKDILKYKEKLNEMEVMKKRIQELEEQNEILYNTKMVLEKQVDTLASKVERLGETEREIVKLKTNVRALIEEKTILETKHQLVLEENARLMLDAQNSLSEVSNLSSELSMIKDKEDTGTCLANECNQISSTQLLRLEHENHRLKVLIEELTQYKASAVPQAVVTESEDHDAIYEKASVNDDVTSEDRQVEVVASLTSVKKTLHSKETELTVLQEKLKKKEEFANIVSESLSVKEQENSELQDRIQQLMNQKRRTEQLIHRKDEDVAELERRLEEVIADRHKSEENLRKKSREINELSNSLSELKEDKERSVEVAQKKTRDVTDLKDRMEILVLEKDKLVDNCAVKDKRLVDLENRLERLQDANRDLAETLESKLEKISSQETRVNELIASAKEDERRHSEIVREKDRRLKEFERKIADLIELESELERLNSQIKQKDRKSDGFLKTIESKDQEIVELENRLEDAKSSNNKLLYNLELKEKKVDSLEQRLLNAESKAEKHETSDDEASRKILETRDDKILELESRLEDALNSSKKLQHTLKVKDEKIVTLETRLEEALTVQLERDKLVKSLEEKKKRIAELESSLDDVTGENQKLSCDLRLKENKVKDLEERVRTLEAENKDAEKIRHVIKEKEDKMFTLTENLEANMKQLAVLENRIEEANNQNKKITHAVKIKEERIASLEESVVELEELTNQNQKLKQIAQQKGDKIRAMEEKMDEYEEATRKSNRLTQKVMDREERIRALNEKLTELETLGINNEKLNLLIVQKDERIKFLELSLEDIQLECTNLENEMKKIQRRYEEKVKRSLEDVDIHKIRRQESVRRREEQIKSLEQSKSKYETMLQAQEGHIQVLQDRLEGSVTERNKLGSSISKKETTINELQTKIIELEEVTTEARRLHELVKIKNETIKRLEDRVREVELVLSRAKSSSRDKDEKIEALQKRIEECTERYKKLDLKMKRKEENSLKTERNLLKMENRGKELEDSLEKSAQQLEEQKTRILELETSLEEKNKEISTVKQNGDVSVEQFEEVLTQSPRSTAPRVEDSNKIRTMKQKLWEAEARIDEIETENGKLQHQVQRREAKVQELEKQLEESTDALEENERLKKNIKHKEERVRILQLSLEQNQKEINSLESRLEGSTSEIYKLRKSDDEKRKRIDSFKMKLEDSDGVLKILAQKEERIITLEERNGELQREMSHLNKDLLACEAELDEVRDTKSSSEETVVKTLSEHRQEVTDIELKHQENIKILNETVEDLRKKNETLILQKESVGDKYMSLTAEKETLTKELEALRSNHEQLINDLSELKDSYTELDLSLAKSLHRCEMLAQMNNTLEEENKMLMEQMNKLLAQNQELLTESLVSRDQFMEEERTFSDRLYELQRQKEKLEEKIEQANRSLAENTPKKKSNLFKKVLQKAGLKKKKDDAVKSKSTVQLIKYDHSPSATEASSDVSAESGPSILGAYPLSPERASDSSNFSEGANSDISPERDLSPVARRHVRVNRAHRAWQARSEYFAPTMVDGLSMQGRSRSLDTREFIRELVQVQDAKPEWKPSVLESGSSVIVIRNDGTPLSADDSRQFTRTQSFNLGGSGNESGASVHARKKSVESNPQVTRPSIQNTPELAVTRDKTSYTPKSGRRLTDTPVRNISDTSRKSSDVSSSHSRSSSLCSADASSDTSKTTVRHVSSTPSNSISSRASTISNESKMEKKRGKNSGKISDDKEGRVIDELRLSSGSGDSTGNDKQKRISRLQTPSPPPRMSVAADKPSTETSPSQPCIDSSERCEDKPPTKRSSSFADRPQSPSASKSQVQRQNSDRAFRSSMEAERRNLVHSKPTQMGVTPDKPRQPLSAEHRPSMLGKQAEHATAQSIGIVSFKEVPRVQSAVLESSPQMERKQRQMDVERKSGHSIVEKNMQKKLSGSPEPRGPQTPKVLRRTPKLEDLSLEASSSSQKTPRTSDKSTLWFEYGEV